jgi:hypothetical protein
MIIELRSYSGDRLLDDVVLMSRYMPPEYEVDDLVLDETPEVIVRTRGGGTGVKETHLQVFGFVADRIVRFADFIVDREIIAEGNEERRSGSVSFPEKNKAIYQYTESLIRDGKRTTMKATQTFDFDSNRRTYERTKEPEQAAPADSR